MPWLLWRYILVELLRTILFTTVVLVAVIAFGATIKPLADDNLLTIGQTIKYQLLVTVPMLQFALPFAAGFGATLVLHRLAIDNEIQAMAVSGLSYPRILASVAAPAFARAPVTRIELHDSIFQFQAGKRLVKRLQVERLNVHPTIRKIRGGSSPEVR